MKVLLFFIASLLILGCENSKSKKESSEEKEDNTKRVETVKEPPVYIAFREDDNGVVYLTDSDEDINTLILDLRPLGVEVALLEPRYWRDDACRRMSSRKCNRGDCVLGNCTLVLVGGWNVCRCQ